MRFRRTATTAVACSVASVVALAGCGGGSGGDGSAAETEFSKDASGTITAWVGSNPDDVAQARLDYAEAQLGAVEIKLDATSFDPQKFTTRVASGQVADVTRMSANEVATYASQDLILPVDECFAAHGMDTESYYYPSVMDDVTYDGKIYAVPEFYQPPAIILNMRVMKKAGVKPEDIDTSDPARLLAAIKKMYEEKNGNPSTLGFDPVAAGNPALWFLGSGGSVTDEQGKPTLDDPSNVDALEYLKEIHDAQGGFAKIKSFTDSFDSFGDKNQYVTDQVGAQVNAQWYVNVLTPYVKQVEISAVPFRNSEGDPFTVSSGAAFVIPAGAKNQDAACAWAINMVKEEAWMAAGEARAKTVEQTEGAMNTGLFTGSPVADQAVKEAFVTSTGNQGFDETIQTYYDIVDGGKSFGASPAGQQINDELVNVISTVLLGQKEPEQALEDAQAAAMRAYEQTTG